MSDSKRSLRVIEGGLNQQIQNIIDKHSDPTNPDIHAGIDGILEDLEILRLRKQEAVAHLSLVKPKP
ncbi:MAG: hypothetical protein CO186_05760 [Zetaproteobacteria bacterium CG_4_9_14_3_um_filter_49_83]|nr:MAG: hypothetical protein AUJ56_12385 [Zetaproteobacteria bacterium CG1_02_49_23]PIQ31289.1 MAG: hypothetical protein COW62_10305 [Zetaproteobacteria bacterium CG17_big_fil_post_rev_8_21_14_2_50_50_13]PIV30584.1 MAG: hypothetical protein COS35_05965 [Zetaproteobacteria bacterium CG02_land_8_20_14_3_00_50_9]PIY55607.1 MAG: hypothetical protein COZ00_08830 [Zetaproteobacteria bacterium CG_4_10_14_0_8_um_filter_49_80]PJA35499.1 MAG: hypothetical protein CO186_05760 [Zetaproteobacteria bacterium